MIAKVIGGYTSTSNEVAGLERGDGNCSSVGINTGGFGPYIAAGKANVLLDDFVPNPATAYYSYVQSAMTLPQAYKAFPATTKTESLARVALTEVTGTGIGHEFNLQPRVASYKVAAMRAALGLSRERVIVLGDGANDLPMMAEAGVSIAYRAKPVVKAKASYCFDRVGLDGLLSLFPA